MAARIAAVIKMVRNMIVRVLDFIIYNSVKIRADQLNFHFVTREQKKFNCRHFFAIDTLSGL